MDIDELWVPVAEYDGLYEVSTTGRVRSVDRVDPRGNRIQGRELIPELRPSGHLRVTLCREGKTKRFWVHRLVLNAFVGPILPGTEACHNDGNPANNVPSNLRWDTKKSNAQDRRRHGTDARARTTHCPQGHEYTADNTYYSAKRWRHCRICTLTGQHARYRRIKSERG